MMIWSWGYPLATPRRFEGQIRSEVTSNLRYLRLWTPLHHPYITSILRRAHTSVYSANLRFVSAQFRNLNFLVPPNATNAFKDAKTYVLSFYDHLRALKNCRVEQIEKLWFSPKLKNRSVQTQICLNMSSQGCAVVKCFARFRPILCIWKWWFDLEDTP